MPSAPSEPIEHTDHLQAAKALLASAGRVDPEHTDRCVFHRDDTPPLLAAMAHGLLAFTEAMDAVVVEMRRRPGIAADETELRHGNLDAPVPAEPMEAPAVTRYDPRTQLRRGAEYLAYGQVRAETDG